MLRDELYSKIGLVGSLGLAILIPKKLGIESFTKCRDRYRANRAHAVIFKLYNFDRGTVLLRQRSELQSLIEIPTLNHGIVIHLKTIKIYQNS